MSSSDYTCRHGVAVMRHECQSCQSEPIPIQTKIDSWEAELERTEERITLMQEVLAEAITSKLKIQETLKQLKDL